MPTLFLLCTTLMSHHNSYSCDSYLTPPCQAILGGSVDVLTLDGMVSMKIPAGTQPDDVLLLRNKGIKALNAPTRRCVALVVSAFLSEVMDCTFLVPT